MRKTGWDIRGQAGALGAAFRREPDPCRLPGGRRRGVTLVEIIIALTVLVVAILGLMSLMLSSQRLNQEHRENTIAQNATQTMIESMREQEFSRIFALYNGDPDDDPDGPGTAPGPHFDIPGLNAPSGGLAGRIEFPTLDGSLREDVDDLMLELPHDLNGDGFIDSGDRSGDYRILPVSVVVEWASVGRDNRITYRTRFIEE